jgi:site-specific DNA-cytosine methylase
MTDDSKFLTGQALSTAIRKLVTEENAILRLAVAYWGSKALELLNIDQSTSKDIRIICDPWKGGCDPDVLQSLFEDKKFEIRHTRNIHAKVYLGTSSVIVGSSNASSNGIGSISGNKSHYIEAAINSKESNILRTATQWFDQQFGDDFSTLLTEADISEIRSIWADTQLRRQISESVELSLIEALGSGPIKSVADQLVF